MVGDVGESVWIKGDAYFLSWEHVRVCCSMPKLEGEKHTKFICEVGCQQRAGVRTH